MRYFLILNPILRSNNDKEGERMIVRVILSSSNDRIGIGNLQFIKVDTSRDYEDEDQEGRFLIDVNGDRHYYYDYVREDDIDRVFNS